MKTQMIENRDFGADVEPAGVAEALASLMNPIFSLGTPGYLGDREQIERELDAIAAAIRTFHAKPPDLVMKECSAYTARLTEMEVLLHRIEGSSRQYTRIRTMQVQKFIEELERQWRTASRLVEVARQDIAVLRGQM